MLNPSANSPRIEELALLNSAGSFLGGSSNLTDPGFDFLQALLDLDLVFDLGTLHDLDFELLADRQRIARFPVLQLRDRTTRDSPRFVYDDGDKAGAGATISRVCLDREEIEALGDMNWSLALAQGPLLPAQKLNYGELAAAELLQRQMAPAT